MATRIRLLLVVALSIALVFSTLTIHAAETPNIDEEIVVPGWWVIGPFMSGVREAGTDALAYDRDATAFKTPLLQPSFPSALVPGGYARWRYYTVDEKGMLTVDYPEVPEEAMKLVTDEWGFAGGYTVGYAYASVHIEDGPRRALMDLRHAGGVSINGIPWPGDPYGHGMGLTPVLFEDGDNELKISIGSRQRFSLKFLPAEDDLIAFTQSATLPDLVRGEAPPMYVGLPLANTSTEWLSLESVSIEPAELLGDASFFSLRIPPLCVANLAIHLEPALGKLPAEIEGEELPVTVHLGYTGGELEAELSLRVRDPEQTRKVTFISDMDLSVQYYGLLPPSDFDPGREYGLILSLHGAGVEASGQVNSYQPKDWAYVVAPTNRRRFGFDWQDWGQRDMLEVLAHVKASHNIDENRVHLTGHSMGGHGTWLNALTFPDLWATAAPSAGWTRFDLYVPMFLRKNLLYGEPKANYIWQLVMRGDDPLAIAENALNLPIYALEGSADDNVPPQQPRLLVEQLARLGYDITYKEVPGMGHWWNDPETPGTDCVDSAELNEFWESHVRNPWPKEVVFKTCNYSINDGAYWVKGVPGCVFEDGSIYEDMTIRARVVGNDVIITTDNTIWLELELSRELIAADQACIKIDGDVFNVELTSETNGRHIVFKRYREFWECATEDTIARFESNGFPRNDLWKSVLMKPAVATPGCTGSEEKQAWNLHMARLYSYHWWYRGNGCLPVVLQDELDTYKQKRLDAGLGTVLNCICLGWCGLHYTPAIYPYYDEIHVGVRRIAGRDLTYKFVAQDHFYPVSSLYLIESGTSLEAMKRLPSMMGIYSGSGFPQWMVWDDEVKLKGLGGVVAMGLDAHAHTIDSKLSYFNEDLISRLEP